MATQTDLVSIAPPPLIRIRDLTVGYIAGHGQPPAPALHKVALDIWPGEIVGILGESGAGKSTLAGSILGLLPTSSTRAGSICFQSQVAPNQDLQMQNLLRMGERRWQSIRGARIAMIFQEPGLSLNPVMRVGDQIAEVIRAHRSQSRAVRKQGCEEILREVGFADVQRIYRAYPHQLSGGELHRVAIAQALVCRPELVIADEPTRALDVKAQGEILKVLLEMQRNVGSALIFITHNPALLAGFADRVVIMYAGRVVEQGPVGQVFQRPLHPYTKGLLRLFPGSQDAGLSEGRLPGIPGTLRTADYQTSGCIFEPRCSVRTAVCRNEPFAEQVSDDHRVSCFHYGN